ncbi:Integrase, catalytic core protein [Phytophthora megakarya]|uniref:Integrase, catalytic core protein n=1 Tax=Phytophthora megakarya TaxID=4795 RepID=A0A225W6M7_9STRA|nr:Integrase, catalytic core protein [Phytophthora megakarya]
MSAHLGVTKTLERVRQQAFWPGWRKDVQEFVRECSYCGAGKGSRPWRSGQMQRMPVVDLTGPFSLVVVGAVGPLVLTERNNKYILVFVDYFTRWAEAFAVKLLDTVTFVETLVNGVVSRHGIPSRLLSDRGSNFISDLAKSFYETLGIKKLFGSAYHPQTQGLVGFNGTLIRMSKMYVSEAQEDWDVYLPRVLFAYRTAYHEALGDTSFFSLYGRDPVLPLDVAFLNLGEKWKSNEVAQYRRELHKSLRDARHVVERQLNKAQDRHKQRLQHQVAVRFEIGDPVWVYQFFRARRGENRIKKLAFSWHGPYRIVGKVGENAYSVEIPSYPDKVVTVNVEEEGDGDGPLEETDLPSSSFTERLTVAREDTVIAGTDKPLLEIVAKRTINRSVEYLALTSNYETFWLPRAELMPSYGALVTMFEQAERKKRGLPNYVEVRD